MQAFNKGKFGERYILGGENMTFKEILEMNGNDVPTLNNLGNVLKELKKYKEAIFYYEKALKIKPQDIITNYNLGLLFYELGEFYKSSSFYEKIVKIDPKHIQSYNNLITKQFFGCVNEGIYP